MKTAHTCNSKLICANWQTIILQYSPPFRATCACKCLSTVKSGGVAYALHCAGGAFSNITRKMFSGSKSFLRPLSLPRGVKWSSDIDAPVKTIVRRFQRREIALASLIYVKTRFFFSFQKTLPETVFKFLLPLPVSPVVFVAGWVNPYSMCVPSSG